MLDTEEDKNIFRELYDEYCGVMFKRSYAILKDYELAEDAVQESFIRIVENFDKVIKKKCPQTRKYFVTIVKNVSIDKYRKRNKDNTLSYDEFEWGIIDKLTYTEEMFEDMEFEYCLLKLPESYYTIMSLKYDGGYSCKEIADILKLSEENVKKRLLRARNKLREIINEEVLKADGK